MPIPSPDRSRRSEAASRQQSESKGQHPHVQVRLYCTYHGETGPSGVPSCHTSGGCARQLEKPRAIRPRYHQRSAIFLRFFWRSMDLLLRSKGANMIRTRVSVHLWAKAAHFNAQNAAHATRLKSRQHNASGASYAGSGQTRSQSLFPRVRPLRCRLWVFLTPCSNIVRTAGASLLGRSSVDGMGNVICSSGWVQYSSVD